MWILALALACKPADTDASDTDATAEPLRVGLLAPETGGLAFLGPAMLAGAGLAVSDIEADGSLPGGVRQQLADSSDSEEQAQAAAATLLDDGNTVIVGALSSHISFAVIDAVTAAGAVQISPANTSADFTDYADGGLYFRTAPSDALQGIALADRIVTDGRAGRVAILAIDDGYALTLADAVTAAVADGGGQVVATVTHGYDDASFAGPAGEIAASDPDSVVILGFDETARVIPDLVAAGVGPQDVATYLTDGNLGDYSGSLDAGTMTGVQGTLPGAPVDEALLARLVATEPGLEDAIYAPEAYDAVILAALASLAAGSTDGDAIAAEMIAVSSGGTPCATFAACAAGIAAGDDIDYDGLSGRIEFTAAGDPGEATFGILTYDADNVPSSAEYAVAAY
jgi:ABC-type branched-subunit amino acid transport system substrate-binding protein